MSKQPVYTFKGTSLYLGACAFLIVIGGTVLYVSGEEILRCERSGTNRSTCHLSRRIGPLTVRGVDLGAVTGADVEEVGGGIRFWAGGSSRQPEVRSSSYVLRYRSDLGLVSSRAMDEIGPPTAIRAALAAFAADPGQIALEQTLPAESAKIAWSVFGLGAFLAALWTLGFLFPSTRSEV